MHFKIAALNEGMTTLVACVYFLTSVRSLHSLHLNGFSPVYVRLCMMRSVVVEEAYLHWVHL